MNRKRLGTLSTLRAMIRHRLFMVRMKAAFWLLGDSSVIHGFYFYGIPISSTIRDSKGMVLAEAMRPVILSGNVSLPENDPSKRPEYERMIREILSQG